MGVLALHPYAMPRTRLMRPGSVRLMGERERKAGTCKATSSKPEDEALRRDMFIFMSSWRERKLLRFRAHTEAASSKDLHAESLQQWHSDGSNDVHPNVLGTAGEAAKSHHHGELRKRSDGEQRFNEVSETAACPAVMMQIPTEWVRTPQSHRTPNAPDLPPATNNCARSVAQRCASFVHEYFAAVNQLLQKSQEARFEITEADLRRIDAIMRCRKRNTRWRRPPGPHRCEYPRCELPSE